MKEKVILLGAQPIRKNKAGEPLDFSVVKIAMKKGEGKGWEPFEFTYGNANISEGLNRVVENGSVFAECEFSHGKDFKTGALVMRLENLVVLK
ncbi:Uncharacterised protein [Kingella kingae]|uniref:hypothetical protein n=1 Tax=Kingella kingae TaxID=504 RepID=UPI000E0601CE|nr:hypothetical protein [Kingella kingae]MDK4530785.1 hypothetical protein [Kingella kingae]MDK4535175.1 hypothetical protein [Kingella kingae]MDK4540575.1 hypothetical protein [Kingella kingae]MDK4545549.1 hypothetical protein [Kingella kingae]MDK4554211.1 hypothetical protein [Kingella kingae]